jgi:tetratricopeptide (TPR) repeat protein
MARQQRPSPKSSSNSVVSRKAKATAAAPRPEAAHASPEAPPPGRSSYAEALCHYEQAMLALQQHDYAGAAPALREVLDRFSEEKELTDRARLYLAVCERHLQPPPPEPKTTGDRLYAATLAINVGDATRAITLLNKVCHDDPGHDQALYLMAVAHGLNGEPHLAVPFLARAIEANPGNRARARIDPDLDALRHDARLAALLQPQADAAARRLRSGQ